MHNDTSKIRFGTPTQYTGWRMTIIIRVSNSENQIRAVADIFRFINFLKFKN